MNISPRKLIQLALLLAIASLAFVYPSIARADELGAGPKLDVEKKVSVDGEKWKDASQPDDAVYVEIGAPVYWQIKLENEGKATVPVTIVDMLDDAEVMLADVCQEAPPSELAPDQKWTCTFDTVAEEGLHKNAVSVTIADAAAAGHVYDSDMQDEAYYQGGTVPPDGGDGGVLEVEKKVSVDGEEWKDAGSPDDAVYVEPGAPVYWQIKVENEGMEPVSVTISDTLDDAEIVLTDVCEVAPPSELAADETWTCTFSTEAEEGLHKNVVAVSVEVGGSTAALEGTVQDVAFYQSGTMPPDGGEDDVLEVEKKVSRDGENWEDADMPYSALQIMDGADVYWTISVENKSDGDLTVDIVDKMDDADFALPAECGVLTGLLLPAAQKFECTFTTVAALDAHMNVVTVASEYMGEPLERSDAAYYMGVTEIDDDTEEGCGQGYWKTHLLDWGATGIEPGASYGETFGVTPSFGEKTLIEAIWQGGGSEMTLGRKAVTALLNAAHPDVNFPMTVDEVIAQVQAAYAAGEYVPVTDYLESISEGYCPLGDDDDGPGRQPGAGTPRFWRNHHHIWPMFRLFVGHREYMRQEALEFMSRARDHYSRGASAAATADVTYDLFSAVVAGRLNVAAGNDASCVSATLDAADEWLAANAVGSGVSEDAAVWQAAAPLYDTLTAYNSGELCAPALADDTQVPSLFLPLMAGLR